MKTLEPTKMLEPHFFGTIRPKIKKKNSPSLYPGIDFIIFLNEGRPTICLIRNTVSRNIARISMTDEKAVSRAPELKSFYTVLNWLILQWSDFKLTS